MTNQWLDEEGLRLFTQWLGMNYGLRVFGADFERHAQRIFSHATSVIASRRAALEPSADAALIERMKGCLRNCRDNLYHPHMPNLIAALEKEIDELTGGTG